MTKNLKYALQWAALIAGFLTPALSPAQITPVAEPTYTDECDAKEKLKDLPKKMCSQFDLLKRTSDREQYRNACMTYYQQALKAVDVACEFRKDFQKLKERNAKRRPVGIVSSAPAYLTSSQRALQNVASMNDLILRNLVDIRRGQLLSAAEILQSDHSRLEDSLKKLFTFGKHTVDQEISPTCDSSLQGRDSSYLIFAVAALTASDLERVHDRLKWEVTRFSQEQKKQGDIFDGLALESKRKGAEMTTAGAVPEPAKEDEHAAPYARNLALVKAADEAEKKLIPRLIGHGPIGPITKPSFGAAGVIGISLGIALEYHGDEHLDASLVVGNLLRVTYITLGGLGALPSGGTTVLAAAGVELVITKLEHDMKLFLISEKQILLEKHRKIALGLLKTCPDFNAFQVAVVFNRHVNKGSCAAYPGDIDMDNVCKYKQ